MPLRRREQGNPLVGARYRQLREECGLTQEELGNLIGVGRELISDIERGKVKPWPEEARKMHDKLIFAVYPYTVGTVTARIFPLMTGIGKGKAWGKDRLSFTYQHTPLTLPEPLEALRLQLVAQEHHQAALANFEYWNGPNTRLITYEPNVQPRRTEPLFPKLVLGPVSWDDYVVGNRMLDAFSIVALHKTPREAYADENLLIVRDVQRVPLSNILTISVVIRTRDDWTVVSKRTRHQQDTPGKLQGSASENIDRWADEPSDPDNPWSIPNSVRYPDIDSRTLPADYSPQSKSHPGPNLFYTVIRGIREEAGREIANFVTPDDVYFIALVWDRDGFNPHLYAYVDIPHPKTTLEKYTLAYRTEGNWEVTPFWVPFHLSGELIHLLRYDDWADVSKGAVLMALQHRWTYEKVAEALS
jgi:DNA-binding XRE family transcriptional regulator